MYYSPVRHSSPKWSVRLACIRHAASVHPEPGSNSPLSYFFQTTLVCLALFCFLFISKLSLTLCFILSCSVFNVLSLDSLVECPFILPSSLPFVKLFLYLFLFFSLFPSFFAFISLFFYLYFFVMIKRNDLYRTFLCLMTIWFLYCPGWSLLVHHWSVRHSSSLQRYTYFYKKRSLTLS